MVCPLHDHLRDYPKANNSSGPTRDMYNVMAENHEGQKRKLTGEWYIAHTIGVEEIVHLVTEDPEVRMAALGHDLVEDTGVTIEKIADKFGDRSVLEIGQKRLPDCELNEYLSELIDLFETEVIGRRDGVESVSDVTE